MQATVMDFGGHVQEVPCGPGAIHSRDYRVNVLPKFQRQRGCVIPLGECRSQWGRITSAATRLN